MIFDVWLITSFKIMSSSRLKSWLFNVAFLLLIFKNFAFNFFNLKTSFAAVSFYHTTRIVADWLKFCLKSMSSSSSASDLIFQWILRKFFMSASFWKSIFNWRSVLNRRERDFEVSRQKWLKKWCDRDESELTVRLLLTLLSALTRALIERLTRSRVTESIMMTTTRSKARWSWVAVGCDVSSSRE